MKESISIKNLGPIKDIIIDGIKPFTVLIGESGSGKSTLMKVIALFRWLYKQQNIESYLNASNNAASFVLISKKIFQNCGLDQFITDDTEIHYTVSFDGSYSYTIDYTKEKEYINSIRIDSNDISFSKIGFISETRTIIPHWLNKAVSIKGASLGFYFDEVLSDFNQAQELTGGGIEMPFLNTHFHVTKNELGKKYMVNSLESDDFDIEYKDSSSGIKNVVPIALITEYFSKNFSFEKAFNRSVLDILSDSDNLTEFKPIRNLSTMEKKIFLHIEEPELSLYPDAQCALMDDLVSKCFINNKNEIELFISTHSPYIINHLNLLIKRFDKNADGAKYSYDDIAVYQVVNGKISDLKIQNERLINTNLLSETINTIYSKYKKLG
ncbi:hypothetical protein FACS189461_5250 [Spirochaetia bacterium]|nr:hypothetical protein FACS189461_5250 [Spirochaetia bacterium]